ncbi:DUF4189 domain-containing protein [Dyella sp.]|uniref:DUF4189 domain-containing protein n=1 Tax=Dyella sp. TaxID=1869338 RepID=UPI0039C8683B
MALLCACLFVASRPISAEGGCPVGYAPSGVGPGGVQGCAPLPGASSPDNATQAGVWADRYGAVATDPHLGILGTSKSMESRSLAEKAALDSCKSQGGLGCKVNAWYRNGCVAMSSGDNAYAVKSGPDQNTATKASMDSCQSDGTTGCHVYYTDCSMSQRVR